MWLGDWKRLLIMGIGITEASIAELEGQVTYWARMHDSGGWDGKRSFFFCQCSFLLRSAKHAPQMPQPSSIRTSLQLKQLTLDRSTPTCGPSFSGTR
jgi:hypothetical protein